MNGQKGQLIVERDSDTSFKTWRIEEQIIEIAQLKALLKSREEEIVELKLELSSHDAKYSCRYKNGG